MEVRLARGLEGVATDRAGPRADGGGTRLRDGQDDGRDRVEIGVTAGQAGGGAGHGGEPARRRILNWNRGCWTDWEAGLEAGSQAGAELGAGSRQSSPGGGDSGPDVRAVGGTCGELIDIIDAGSFGGRGGAWAGEGGRAGPAEPPPVSPRT